MTSGTPHSPRRRPEPDALAFIAAQALRDVARRRGAAMRQGGAPEGSVHSAFTGMLFAPDYAGDDAVAASLAANGVSPDQMMGHLIPSAADRLGADWRADQMSFAKVTIIAARLQRLAWRFIENARAAADHAPGAPRALVALPAGETHSLGCVLAIGALERLGADVTSAIGSTNQEVAALARAGRYDIIAISAPASVDLARLRALIQRIRAGGGAPPIVVGGSLLTRAPGAAQSLGPDLATNDAAAALRLIPWLGDEAAGDQNQRRAARPAAKGNGRKE